MKRIEIPLRCGKVIVVIDHENNQAWKEFYDNKNNIVPNMKTVYHLDEDWIKNLTLCKVCNQPLDDDSFAWAFWQLKSEYCSTSCWKTDHVEREPITKK